MFQRVLVANRGEIAVRVMRTARELGISPIAIYSEADAHALHVRMADQAVCVGPEASTQSYLNMDAVLDAARRTGADAIHPGYGFLSENAIFAQKVMDAGIAWVGPPPSAIAQMGDKLTARETVAKAGVPLVPGATPTDLDAARAAAIDMGVPVMVKASAGGGGKGMRKVDQVETFDSALLAARREAAAAFGDDRVYVEKFITRPHHVEIQVLCDGHGTALYIGERECSVQRRHQKVIEECPSPFIDADLRQRMGAVAVAAAQACDYVGAGTVEFLVGGDGGFYFLEMNTRLQVEHPVTELVYGIDLVEWQLRIAAGEPLPFTQADIQPRGHAVQCRLYAEDPETFLPSPGTVHHVRWPTGPGVRIDAGIDSASVVPMAYDPMIAKLCTYAADRARAISRMHRALDETVVLGVTTNIPLHHRVLMHPEFLAGDYDTGLLGTPLPTAPSASDDAAVVAAAIQRYLTESHQAGADDTPSAWWRDGRRF
jgi:acetyl-CoA carboxylase biotin carboxylase subunit